MNNGKIEDLHQANGEYQDIFYTIMITNWMMGLVVLTFVPFFLKRVFKISFKRLFVF